MNWKELDLRTIAGFVILLIIVVLSFWNNHNLHKVPNLDQRILFGFGMLQVLAILALIISLAHVTQESSYGLEIILGSLATLAGQFSQWAFGKARDNKEPEKP